VNLCPTKRKKKVMGVLKPGNYIRWSSFIQLGLVRLKFQIDGARTNEELRCKVFHLKFIVKKFKCLNDFRFLNIGFSHQSPLVENEKFNPLLSQSHAYCWTISRSWWVVVAKFKKKSKLWYFLLVISHSLEIILLKYCGLE